MSLKIYLLGQFKLQANDLPVELPSRPAQSLLAFLDASDISLTFNNLSNYWLDARQLLLPTDTLPLDQLIEITSLYRGELLPGFYDEWVVSEQDHLLAAYHQKMHLLLEGLLQERRWEEALDASEGWIRLGHARSN